MTAILKRGAIVVSEIEGPAFLAPALVNGDYSGLSDEDEALLNEYLGYLGDACRVVSTTDEEQYFGTIWFNGHRFAGDLVKYVVHS